MMHNTVYPNHRCEGFSELPQKSSHGPRKYGLIKSVANTKHSSEVYNILKEDYNAKPAKSDSINLSLRSSRTLWSQELICYRKSKDTPSKESKKSLSKGESVSQKQSRLSNKKANESKSGKENKKCCETTSTTPNSRTCESLIRANSKNSYDMKSVKLNSNRDTPLNKALGDVNKAMSFDKRCGEKISELMEAQKQLQQQIQQLEDKEVEELKKLKEAKSIWPCMEEAYENKIQGALERQHALRQQIIEVDASMTKWRRNKKNLEFEIRSLNKYHQEIKELIRENSNNITLMKKEIETLEKRIEYTEKQIAAVNETMKNKTKTSDIRVKSLLTEIARIKKTDYEEQNHKREKELEGSKCVKEGRKDLYKIYRIMLQKKLENEHLGTEKEDLKHEINFIKTTCEKCKVKCQNKDKKLLKDIAQVDSDIADFKVRCVPCHKCIDTSDMRTFCTDCPRCIEERNCLFEGSHCFQDVTTKCICESTKEKLMNNVFKNMNTILVNQIHTPSGKTLADQILKYLRKSRNGKLNEETRKILQDFILTTIKNNLNSTVIGGAMKTRCEMDSDAYKRLMLCLQGIKMAQPSKEDKETVPKRDPCCRWGGSNECNCPRGPAFCACTKDLCADDSKMRKETKTDLGEMTLCPRNVSVTCGRDCFKNSDFKTNSNMTSLNEASCISKKCPYAKTTAAVQCILEQSYLSPSIVANTPKNAAPYASDVLILYNQAERRSTPKNPGANQLFIKKNATEEIMQRYPGKSKIEQAKFRIPNIAPMNKQAISFPRSARFVTPRAYYN